MRRMLADIGPLRESVAFRRLWIGSTLSSVGGALTGFAIPLQVYDLTRSPFAVGLIGVAVMVPTLAIGLLGGSLADTTDPRKLVLVTTIGLAGVSGVLAAQAFAGLRLVWLLYFLVTVQSALSAIGTPARRSLIPGLLSAEQLPAGLALIRLSFQIMLTIGPALGGIVAADPDLGLPACYLIDAVSFAASLYGVAGLPVLSVHAAQSRPSPRAAIEGVRFVCGSQRIFGAFLADLNATIFGLPFALFPAINTEQFGGDPRTLGLFTAAVGVGGLVSAALSVPLNRLSLPRTSNAHLGDLVGSGLCWFCNRSRTVANVEFAGCCRRSGYRHRGAQGHDRPSEHSRSPPRPGYCGRVRRGH